MKKEDVIKILLDNGFEEQEYKSIVNDNYHIEYIPLYKHTEIYLNKGIMVRTTDDENFRIHFFNDEMCFLGNYQDYWAGWYKQCFKVDINIIDDIEIYHDIEVINDISIVQEQL